LGGRGLPRDRVARDDRLLAGALPGVDDRGEHVEDSLGGRRADDPLLRGLVLPDHLARPVDDLPDDRRRVVDPVVGEGAEGSRHPLLHRASLDSLICLDQPYHLPLRAEHMTFFKPAYINALKKSVDVRVAQLLDGMAAQGPVVDMVTLFSAELPLFTLCEMLGVPQADRPKIIHWMHFLEMAGYLLQQQGAGSVSEETINEFLQEVQAMFDYGRSILLARRRNPRDDLLSAIANARIEGELLPDEFLDGSWLLIIFAGNDTTRNSLSGTMKLLTQFPDQRSKLLAREELLPNAMQEAVRMVSPVMYMRRTATSDTEVGGQQIAQGEKVLMYYGAANRDPAVFQNPDQFDIERANASKHLAFGTGPHVCLGQRVARMQLESAYRQILARFPEARWTGEEEIAPNSFVHAISKLEVDLGPQAR
jgi:cytochrome P450